MHLHVNLTDQGASGVYSVTCINHILTSDFNMTQEVCYLSDINIVS